MMFQCPAVGTGSFCITTSMTQGRLDLIARSSAGLNSAAALIFMPSMPWALAIAAKSGEYGLPSFSNTVPNVVPKCANP